MSAPGQLFLGNKVVQFLTVCFTNFVVGVWNATAKNVLHLLHCSGLAQFVCWLTKANGTDEFSPPVLWSFSQAPFINCTLTFLKWTVLRFNFTISAYRSCGIIVTNDTYRISVQYKTTECTTECQLAGSTRWKVTGSEKWCILWGTWTKVAGQATTAVPYDAK